MIPTPEIESVGKLIFEKLPPPAGVTPTLDTKVELLGYDSLEMFDIIDLVEDTTGVEVDVDRLNSSMTLRQLITECLKV